MTFEGVCMGNILLISDRPKPYDDLISQFKQTDFPVVTKKYAAAMHKKNADQIYDFVLYELKSSFEGNVQYLTPIVKAGTVPIYVIGELNESDEIAYYKLGVQGIIRIPFNAAIIAARIVSIIRLLEKTSRLIRKVKFGPVEIDLHNRFVKKHDLHLKLTNVEAKILRILFNNKNHIVDKDAIIHFAWDDDESATDNALSIHITRLRNKIEFDKSKPLIDTIWGTGYRLNYYAEE